MTHVTERPRSSRPLPVWNEHPITCPHCRRHFTTHTIRILRLGSTWVCHRCYNAAQDTHPKYRRVNGVLEGTCTTCGQEIGRRRAQTNTQGQLVHYRCPPKAQPRHND